MNIDTERQIEHILSWGLAEACEGEGNGLG